MNLPEIEFDQKVSEEHKAAVGDYITSFEQTGVPAILSMEHFALVSGLKPETLFGITNSPQAFYRTFSLRKANGGVRRIDAPLPTVLLAQRWILKNVLEKKACHPAAKAYLKDSSIRANARFHRSQNFVLKVDVKDFFGSISDFKVFTIFKDFGYTNAVATGLSRICCLNNCLPQGAATSGYLSNILLSDFDTQIFKFCRERNLRYSRYADDMAISGEAIERDVVVGKISDLLHAEGLKLNKAKTRLIPNSNRQKITGVVVNEKLSVESSYLRKLRQSHYYIKKHGIFGHARHVKASNPRGLLEKLIGQVSYAHFIRQDDKALAAMKKDFLQERRAAFGS